MNIRNILIVAATRLELEPLLQEWSVGPLPTGKVTSIIQKQMPVDILITGPGMVATAFFLGKLRGLHEYSMVLNAGIAGSFNKALNIGDVVHVSTDCFSELGSWHQERFSPMYDMGMAEDYRPAFLKGSNIIQNNNPPALTAVAELPVAKGVTVNSIKGIPWDATLAGFDYQPDIETMEGAAFFFACMSKNVPCLQIRSISNGIENSLSESWDIPAAVASLQKTILKIVDEL